MRWDKGGNCREEFKRWDLKWRLSRPGGPLTFCDWFPVTGLLCRLHIPTDAPSDAEDVAAVDRRMLPE